MTNNLKHFNHVKKRLNKREKGFEYIFNYLESLDHEPLIIETGTYREENNYEGDGCSTLLFDNYIGRRGGSLLSVDIDPEACDLAIQNTEFAEIVLSDSVEFLGTLEGKCDLLYLDSYNIEDWNNDWAPASHHLKELFAAKNIIVPGTLIVVDDNLRHHGRRLGKGRLIFELMDALGIEPVLDAYQVAWIWEEMK